MAAHQVHPPDLRPSLTCSTLGLCSWRWPPDARWSTLRAPSPATKFSCSIGVRSCLTRGSCSKPVTVNCRKVQHCQGARVRRVVLHKEWDEQVIQSAAVFLDRSFATFLGHLCHFIREEIIYVSDDIVALQIDLSHTLAWITNILLISELFTRCLN